MPLGTYRRLTDGALEEFRCAPGPAGWRYVSSISASAGATALDLVADASWRALRVRIDTGSHSLILERREDRLVGMRDGEPLDLPATDDVDFLSPAFNAVTVNRIGPDARDVEVTYLEQVTCEPSLVRQRYEPMGDEVVETPAGRFRALAWRYRELPEGRPFRLWVAGDVVLAFEDVFELVALDPGPRGPFPI